MIIVGLTGSIAMGKTATARLFAQLRVPIFDADAVVHRLYSVGGAAVPVIQLLFPQAIINGAVDRSRLSAAVVGNDRALAALESVVHPLLISERHKFIAAAGRKCCPYVVLDIPLLFEAGLDRFCDRLVVVTAPPHVQKHRALGRQTMTKDKFKQIKSRQTPDHIKRRLADYVIHTGAGRRTTQWSVKRLHRYLRLATRQGQRWQPGGLRPRPHTGQRTFWLKRGQNA